MAARSISTIAAEVLAGKHRCPHCGGSVSEEVKSLAGEALGQDQVRRLRRPRRSSRSA